MSFKIIDNKDWMALEQRFDWVRDMSHVLQHKFHHAEGSVAVHTQMVIHGLSSIEGYKDLTELEKEILWTSALLHDVEKRSTSIDYGDGMISARGHAEKGEFTARTILYRDLPTPFSIREQIASLVSLHGLPLWFMNQPDPDKAIIAASLRVDTRLLAILSESDARGRKCGDPQGLIKTAHQFRQRCQQLQCWAQAYHFDNTDSRFHYFRTTGASPDEIKYASYRNKAYLLVSLPSIDTSNYIEEHLADLPLVQLSQPLLPNDSLSLKQYQTQLAQVQKLAEAYTVENQDFVCDSHAITVRQRAHLVNHFVSLGSEVEIVYIEHPYQQWIGQSLESQYPLSKAIADKLLSLLEMPQLPEAHNVIYSVN